MDRIKGVWAFDWRIWGSILQILLILSGIATMAGWACVWSSFQIVIHRLEAAI